MNTVYNNSQNKHFSNQYNGSQQTQKCFKDSMDNLFLVESILTQKTFCK